MNPSKYVYWYLRTKEIVFIVSVIGLFFSILGLYLLFFTFFNKKYSIEISEEGIFLGMLPFENRFIKWSEIVSIEEKKVNKIMYMVIYVNDINAKLKKEKKVINRVVFSIALYLQGTPYYTNCKFLNCSHEYLYNTSLSYWRKYKNNHKI